MKRLVLIVVIVAATFFHLRCAIGDTAVSSTTEECLGCHATIHPGIVESWKKSQHAAMTPAAAMAVPGLGRKITAQNVPDELQKVSIGCAECHTLRAKEHKDTFDHNGHDVHIVVSPGDCRTCHVEEAQQYDKNLMAHAYGNLVNNDLYQQLMLSINGSPVLEKGKITLKPANAATDADSCLYCHGTKLQVTGTKVRETSMGEMEFPIISGWPNQGVGRINLDETRGSCAACHTRHDFSIEMARKPYTCRECHVGPDAPANRVYEASKHGNIFSTKQTDWNFKNVPWTIGKDFTAPTCAACHFSLLVDADGKVVSQRTHEVKNRLPWRIFGLIYAHPHPKDADTTGIRNKDGLPLPTDLEGGFATKFLLNPQERTAAAQAMQASCLQCHSKSWEEGFWARFLNTIEQTNSATLAGTQLMQEIWKRGLAAGPGKGGNPFDEFSEKLWSNTWLFYANSIRYSAAMGGGGDYGVFADGRYHLMKSVMELQDWLEARKSTKKP
jgi:hydroxylamine dehydrogenase